MTRILIVEDEAGLRQGLEINLRHENYETVTAGDGEEAIRLFHSESPDLVLLDLMLPKKSGFEVLDHIRKVSKIPVILLTARGQETDKVRGLRGGADDYVTKPFGAEELLARVRATLRRTETGPVRAGSVVRGDVVIDVDRHRVTRGADELRLTPKEFDLLVFFAQHPGRVLTHRTILKAIWGPNAVDQPEHLRVLVASLRRKLEPDPAQPRYILTEPWVGYRFADE